MYPLCPLLQKSQPQAPWMQATHIPGQSSQESIAEHVREPRGARLEEARTSLTHVSFRRDHLVQPEQGEAGAAFV